VEPEEPGGLGAGVRSEVERGHGSVESYVFVQMNEGTTALGFRRLLNTTPTATD
jgi:hypothetical protein